MSHAFPKENRITCTALGRHNMQSTYILVLMTLLRDQRPFLLLLLLLLILILLLSLTSWNLNAPKTQHRTQRGGVNES